MRKIIDWFKEETVEKVISCAFIAFIIFLLSCSVAHAQTVARKDSAIEVAFRTGELVIVIYDLPKCYQPQSEYVISYESYKKAIIKQRMDYLLKAVWSTMELDIEDNKSILKEIKRIVNSATIE